MTTATSTASAAWPKSSRASRRSSRPCPSSVSSPVRRPATAARRPGDRRHLRAGRRRLRAAVADVADDQLRAGRVRDAACLLRPRGDEVRRLVVPDGDAGRLRRLASRARPAVQAAGGGSGDTPRRPAARHLDHRARDPDEGGREGVLRRGRPTVPRGLGDDQPASCRDGRIGAEPGHHCGGGAHRGGSAVLPRRHAHRPTHAGHRAEPGARARARHPGRPHGALHLPHQRRPGGPRFVSGEPDLPRQIHQRRDARPGRLRRRHRRGLQPGARRHRRRAAARRSGQLRCRVPLGAVPGRHPAVSPHRRDPLAAAGVARASGRAHRMRRVLLFVGVALLIAAPFGLKPYGIYLLSLWAVMTIAAIGLNLTLGYAGQISLAQASFVGIGAYTAALLTTQGWPLGAAFAVAALLCFVIGWLLGYPALRVAHHYLAFVTLSFATLVFLVLRNEEWLTKGVYGISGIPAPAPLGWSTKAPQDFYFFCLGVLALASIAAWWLLRSPWGRAFTALRENPIRASSLGIDTRRYTLMAFAIGSALGGVAGVLYAPLVQFIEPTAFTLGLSFNLLLMVIVGGAGRFFGPFLGAAVSVLLPEWLRFSEGLYLMLYAVFVMVLLAFFPSGLLGLAERLRTSGRGPRSPRAEEVVRRH